jgi:predicted DNA-binding transcriptional regulator YafY
VAALQAAGVPLWTEGGHGGGIRLVEGWRTRLDGLTAEEAGALFLAGAPGAVDELGLSTVLAAAQVKVLSALPPELRDRAGRVRERFLLDAPGWFHRGDPPARLGDVAGAVRSGRRLDVGYGRPGRERLWRLAPLGLVLKAGTWYLVAATVSGGQVLTFRLDRISSATARAEAVERPDGFDLQTFWAADFDRTLQREPVRLRLGPRAAAALPHVMGTSAGTRALACAGPPEMPAGWKPSCGWNPRRWPSSS